MKWPSIFHISLKLIWFSWKLSRKWRISPSFLTLKDRFHFSVDAWCHTRSTNMNVYMWEKSGQNGQNKYCHSKIDLNLRFVPMDNPIISHWIINIELIYAFGVIFLIWKKKSYHSKNNQELTFALPIMHFESILNWRWYNLFCFK